MTCPWLEVIVYFCYTELGILENHPHNPTLGISIIDRLGYYKAADIGLVYL